MHTTTCLDRMHSTNSNLGFNSTDVGLTATGCSACLLDVVNTVNKMFNYADDGRASQDK